MTDPFGDLRAVKPDPRPANECRRGHPLDDAYVRPNGKRECRECRTLVRRTAERRDVKCPACSEVRQVTGPTSPYCRSCAQIRHQQSGKDFWCEHCGNLFRVKNSQMSWRKPRWCSSECRVRGGGYKELGRKLSLDRGGDGNPSYKHGRRAGVQIPGWRLREKGESSCRNCGGTDRLQLHHIIPRGKSTFSRADLRNGVPLCGECHTGWHGKRVTIYRDILTEDEWSYLLSVPLTGELVETWLDKHYPIRPAQAAA